MTWNGRDADTLVAMAVDGHFYQLKQLLADEADKYASFTADSPLVLAIAKAYADLKVMPGHGPFDDLHPRWLLRHTCPHPLADEMGFCDCCGADLEPDEAAT